MNAPGSIFRKYVVLVGGLVGAMLLAAGVIEAAFTYRDSKSAAVQLAREKALGAASRVEHSVTEIARQLAWTTLPLPETDEAAILRRRFELRNLLRLVPAVMEARTVDARGREQVRVSRIERDLLASGVDLSRDPAFLEARGGRDHYGPVRFVHESEPWITIATTADRERSTIGLAEINLRFIWDVVSRIRIGASGYAYAVDREGRLVAHPDLSRVLANTSLRHLPQVEAALAARPVEGLVAENADGRRVLAAAAPIAALGWHVIVEEPVEEALAPTFAAAQRIGLLLALGLALAIAASFALARRMSRPIEALEAGVRELARGALEHRVDIRTGDELESLARRFNEMAERLRDSYAGLEAKVVLRTEELARANEAKSRFLAIASHDLRQPMHALGLFAAQLAAKALPPEARRLAQGIESSVNALGGMLDSLLDLSRLEAGAQRVQEADIALGPLLESLERAFAPAAREKGLRLRVRPTRLVARTDAALVERIAMNLVSNAIRYTSRGGVLVAVRRRSERVVLQVWDTGPGIPEERREEIFSEFVRLGDAETHGTPGLGLGLAIVERLARVLGTRVRVDSRMGRGSLFSVEVAASERATAPIVPAPELHAFAGRVVAVVDDDPAALSGLRGLLESWGCVVFGAASADELIAQFRGRAAPDAVISDFRLRSETGDEVVRRLRESCGSTVQAFLLSGDTSPEVVRTAARAGLPLFPKPVSPMKLRAMLTHLLAARA